MGNNLENTIIYLIGFGGVGKLTIATELEKLEDFRIVHNQLINNPIFSVVEKVEDQFPAYVWKKIRQIRDVVFETIKENSPQNLNFVFTNELIEGSKGDLELYNKVVEIAAARGSKFVPVRLTVTDNEHRKRLVSEERKKSFKVCDESYADRVNGSEVLKIKHRNLINIDTTLISAQESAKYILNKIKEK